MEDDPGVATSQGWRQKLVQNWRQWRTSRASQPERKSTVSDSKNDRKLSVNDRSSSRVLMARLPSRYLVDIGSTAAQHCELVHFVIKDVQVDCDVLPKRNRGKYKIFCTLSIGRQTFVTPDVTVKEDEQQGSMLRVTCECGVTLVLNEGGANVVRVAVFSRGRLDGALKNTFLGHGQADLAPLVDIARQEWEESQEGSTKAIDKLPGHLYESLIDIMSPSGEKNIGSAVMQARASGIDGLEEQMWERLLLLGDFLGNDGLEFEEYVVVLRTFGADVTDDELREVFERARGLSPEPDNPSVGVKALAKSLAFEGNGKSIAKYLPTCPVDGAVFSTDPALGPSNVLYCWLALSQSVGDSGTEGAEMKSGYLTENEATRAWAMRLSEWASHPVRRARGTTKSPTKKLGGLRLGSAAQHILVFDRQNKLVIEEIVSPVILLAMRALYQSKIGRTFLQNEGFLKRMHLLSVSEGEYRDSEESRKDIESFVDSFKGQLDMSSAEKPMSAYKTFNEFFSRKLKPGARPICPGENIVVSSADCRLTLYSTIDAASRFWVKGRNFSVAGLLGDYDERKNGISKQFFNGSMAIFRLAPQDYHRYHSPISGTIKSITDIPGHLLTVNPIAINCQYADVFTVNKRSVMILETPEFGTVAFVAIGATLVGSIVWTASVGDSVAKGDELGFFQFGGSTCIALFQPGRVTWDEDIVSNSEKSLETLIQMGDHIGIKPGIQLSSSDIQNRAAQVQDAHKAATEAGVVALERRPTIQDQGLRTLTDIHY